MSTSSTPSNEFLSQVTTLIEKNMANEQFGVSELADAMNMSRSNLLRKVKKESTLSVSQLINQVRLNRAMAMLRTGSLNVSEVSHQVGFNSTSYFIKCFREYYGYPPGEVGKHPEVTSNPAAIGKKPNRLWIAVAGATFVVMVLILIYNWSVVAKNEGGLEKSLAVLPFKNESNDSTNVYLINGLMESTLLNLQKIQDLRVISRTSSEKYRNSTKSIPEMAKELNVRYFVEGSGQKIGDQILLNIQLIEASTDRHLWSNQYKREVKDIFQLQEEIAQRIAEEIKAIITPDEKQRIEKRPTENLTAYDLYLKGKNLQLAGGEENELKAIEFFKQAIEQDPKFAVAYADIAIVYYYHDIFRAEKRYAEEINQYADMAFLYDSKLGSSLVAKALAYMIKKEYESAVPYLEKALEYNPNSAEVIGFLSDFYSIYNPNTGKYLSYALKGVQLDIASLDSTTASYTYLRLGNALIQNGFVEESVVYIEKALAYNPANPFAKYVSAFISFAQNKDAKKTRDLLLIEFAKDTTRFDILQDIGKVSYYMKDYEGAYQYYKRFLQIRESRQMDIYRHENLTIAYVLAQQGFKEKSEELVRDYKLFIDQDKSLYKNLGLAAYYTYIGKQKEAVAHMKLFAEEDNVQYWIILFLEEDPLMASILDNPDFKRYLKITKSKFWKAHKELREELDEQGLLVKS